MPRLQTLLVMTILLLAVSSPAFCQYEQEAGKLLFQDVQYPAAAGPGKVSFLRIETLNPDEPMELYVGDMVTKSETRVLPGVNFKDMPFACFGWAPDGSELMVPQLSNGSWELFRYKAGSHVGEKVTNLLQFRDAMDKQVKMEKGWGEDMALTLGQITYSPSGKRVVIKMNRPNGKTALWWVDSQTGNARQVSPDMNAYYGCLDPQDGKMCYTVSKQEKDVMRANEDIILRDLKTGAVDTLCNTLANEFNGVISPNGKYLVYVVRSGAGPNNLWVKNLATKEARQFTSVGAGKNCTQPTWTSDGSQIVFFGVGIAPKPSVFVKSFTPF